MKPYYETKLGKLYHGDCLDIMPELGQVDLVLTSPPYDELRTYNDKLVWNWEIFTGIADQLFRVTKKGGVVVWVVGDATIKGSETGSSFKQALYFKEIGFDLETMIWEKTGSGCLGSNTFYGQNFEYVFILPKGKPKTNNLICDRANKIKSGKVVVNGSLDKSGKGKNRIIDREPFGKRNNIWRFDTQKNSKHPAPFPEQLANDHIISWSNEGDIVFDPMCGSGTTLKQCEQLNRKWIGIEIEEKYCEIATKRIEENLTAMERIERSEKGITKKTGLLF